VPSFIFFSYRASVIYLEAIRFKKWELNECIIDSIVAYLMCEVVLVIINTYIKAAVAAVFFIIIYEIIATICLEPAHKDCGARIMRKKFHI
jgi:hypothetical protein